MSDYVNKENETYAWMSLEDGDLTTFASLARNWVGFGHPVKELTRSQYNALLASHLSFFEDGNE